MSEILAFRSEASLGCGPLEFRDLKRRLEEGLKMASQLPDLERLIRSVNGLVKDATYSSDEKSDLKRLRQRAYDRKRMMKAATHIDLPTFEFAIAPESTAEEKFIMPIHSIDTALADTIVQTDHLTPSFWRGFQSAFTKLDGERFARELPGLLILVFASTMVAWLVWLQSLELYESAGFSQPQQTAAGGLAMVVGFAAFYAVRRTKLALALCLYAGAYEGYFMVSGTFQDERVSAVDRIRSDPELTFLGEKAEKERETYRRLKERYDNADSEVFANTWFKTKHLDPAWDRNEEAQLQYVVKKQSLENNGTGYHVTWLKILYRLGLVFLCMVSAHGIAGKFANRHKSA